MDTVLGLIELAFYVVSILVLSATITFVVVKISPSNSKKAKAEKA